MAQNPACDPPAVMTDHYANTRFLISAAELRQLPPDSGIEVAFAGRSNTGKSSVINVLTRQNRLARVSKTPGRTRLLNCFEVTPGHRIIDLPGYGYARVPEDMKQHWGEVLEAYFHTRTSLRGLILIVDIRHGLKPTDRQMQDWCVSQGLPLHIVLNKADKLSRGAAMGRLQALCAEPDHYGDVQIFSALKKTGLPELGRCLDSWFGWE